MKIPIVLVAGAALVALTTVPDARGAAPTGTPTFSEPLAIDNAYFPVEPGNIQVYLGRDAGRRVTVVVSHRLDTREFTFGDQVVPCRVVAEHTFHSGRLIAEQETYYAQSDDGAVWTFGETDDDDGDADDDDDDDDDERGGWVVGAVAPGDPVGTVSVNAPALMMPAVPEVGDAWLSEDAGPGQTQLAQVRSVAATARVRGSRFAGALRMREEVPGARGGETKWFAAGVGLVRERGGGTQLRLNASTLDGGRR